jgi:hypothetical protein
VAFIHGRIALSAVLFAFALGGWGTWTFLRGHGISPSYWGALVVGEILMLVQGVLGALLAITGNLPPDLLHFLYGALVALTWPGVYVYTHARTGRPESGWYALASFFIFGLAVRAIMTGTAGR